MQNISEGCQSTENLNLICRQDARKVLESKDHLMIDKAELQMETQTNAWLE